ncbi:MAG: hypothetical protein K5867_05900, partial [Bacteroidales bacterium]|nr:hypothetical protein [Bacteroidales bacterium]
MAAVLVFVVLNAGLFLGETSVTDTYALEIEANRRYYFAAALTFPVLAYLHFAACRTFLKRKKGEESPLIRKFFVSVFAAINSYASFYFIELLYNSIFYHMAPKYKILGWGITAAVDIILMGLVNSVSIGMMIGNIFFMALGLINHFVLQFRSLPFQYVDIFAARTALSVASQYTFELTWQMVVMFSFLLSAASVYVNEGLVRIFKKFPLRVLLRAAALGLGGICFYVFIVTSFFTDNGIWFANFEPQSSYTRFGMEACFLGYAKLSIPVPPEGYSEERVEAIIETASENAENENPADLVVPENIIVVMNESFADLSIYPALKISEPVMPFLDSLTENAQQGSLLVSVRGGWTPNSEYEFLMGSSCMYAPTTVVYNGYIKDE